MAALQVSFGGVTLGASTTVERHSSIGSLDGAGGESYPTLFRGDACG